MLIQIRERGRKLPTLEESLALFSRHAVGVLEHLPDQETARRLLLSKVGDFATLGSPGTLKESILGLAINLQNKDFVSHRYCQEILDEMWWGSSLRSGRVCLQKPWPSALAVYAQVVLPFVHILHFEPNDLCDGYPWMDLKALKELGGKNTVNVKWWKVMTSFWYFTKMDVVYFECKNRQQQILSRKKRETKYLKKVASCHPATATTNIAVEVCV